MRACMSELVLVTDYNGTLRLCLKLYRVVEHLGQQVFQINQNLQALNSTLCKMAASMQALVTGQALISQQRLMARCISCGMLVMTACLIWGALKSGRLAHIMQVARPVLRLRPRPWLHRPVWAGGVLCPGHRLCSGLWCGVPSHTCGWHGAS